MPAMRDFTSSLRRLADAADEAADKVAVAFSTARKATRIAANKVQQLADAVDAGFKKAEEVIVGRQGRVIEIAPHKEVEKTIEEDG